MKTFKKTLFISLSFGLATLGIQAAPSAHVSQVIQDSIRGTTGIVQGSEKRECPNDHNLIALKRSQNTRSQEILWVKIYRDGQKLSTNDYMVYKRGNILLVYKSKGTLVCFPKSKGYNKAKWSFVKHGNRVNSFFGRFKVNEMGYKEFANLQTVHFDPDAKKSINKVKVTSSPQDSDEKKKEAYMNDKFSYPNFVKVQ